MSVWGDRLFNKRSFKFTKLYINVAELKYFQIISSMSKDVNYNFPKQRSSADSVSSYLDREISTLTNCHAKKIEKESVFLFAFGTEKWK